MILFKVLHTKLTMTDTNHFYNLINCIKLKYLHGIERKDSILRRRMQENRKNIWVVAARTFSFINVAAI